MIFPLQLRQWSVIHGPLVQRKGYYKTIPVTLTVMVDVILNPFFLLYLHTKRGGGGKQPPPSLPNIVICDSVN